MIEDPRKLKLAFLLGFLVTREGFNEECLCDHLAEERIAPSHRNPEDIPQRLFELLDQAELRSLMDQAISWIEQTDARQRLLSHPLIALNPES